MHCGKIGVVTVTDELRRRWSALLPGSAGSHVLGEGLLERWGEPHRHHHDQRHLLEVLEAVDVLVEVADNALAVRLGAWFHDAVYAGRQTTRSCPQTWRSRHSVGSGSMRAS